MLWFLSIIKCQGRKTGTFQLSNACDTATDPASCCAAKKTNQKCRNTGMAVSTYPRATLLTSSLRGSRGLFALTCYRCWLWGVSTLGLLSGMFSNRQMCPYFPYRKTRW